MLRGYLILKQAVVPDFVDALNTAIDALPPLDYGQGNGNAQRRDYHAATGLELHNCVEAGELTTDEGLRILAVGHTATGRKPDYGCGRAVRPSMKATPVDARIHAL